MSVCASHVSTLSIAILVPCFNEGNTIRRVITDLKSSVPAAKVFVCDNASSDNTRDEALAAGVLVISESRKGKGAAVRRLLNTVDADVFVMIDGDATYDSRAIPSLIDKLIDEKCDLVNGNRLQVDAQSYPAGHRLGNFLFSRSVEVIFGGQSIDMLSGLKIFTRRFAKSFPAASDGFQLETELIVHALNLKSGIGFGQVEYYQRPDGSESKLSTFRDGFLILSEITRLMRDERPFLFFSFISLVVGVLCLLIGLPVIGEYLATGLVMRLPSAVLASGLGLISVFCFLFGFVLQAISSFRAEARRSSFLSVPPPW